MFKSIDDLRGKEHSNLVIQKYISKPYLVDGLKFDMRMYVVIMGIDPMRIYVSKDGLA